MQKYSIDDSEAVMTLHDDVASCTEIVNISLRAEGTQSLKFFSPIDHNANKVEAEAKIALAKYELCVS